VQSGWDAAAQSGTHPQAKVGRCDVADGDQRGHRRGREAIAQQRMDIETRAWPYCLRSMACRQSGGLKGLERVVHILTKILVVFAAVLSLGLAALTSSYAMNRDTITGSFNDAIVARDKANANYEAQSSDFASERQRDQDSYGRLSAQLEALQTAKRDAESKVAELTLEARSANDRADSVMRQIGGLGETVDTQAEIIASQGGELKKTRVDAQKTREQNIALLDRINDLESQNEVLSQSNRSLQESIAEMQANEQNGGTDIAASGSSEPRPLVGDLVVGSIREVRSNNGQQYAEVDLGTRDRLSNNVKLHITRNGDFVANLIIVRTDLQTSVGLVDTIGDSSIQVRPGDTVLSSLTR
jgi:hypothetical protein